MRLQLNQTRKTTATAEFEVLHRGAPIGQMTFENPFGKVKYEGVWTGAIAGRPLGLSYNPEARGPLQSDAAAVYDVTVDGALAGRAAREGDPVATGLNVWRYAMDFRGARYTAWPFSMGRKGYRYPVFKEDAADAPLYADGGYGEVPFAGGRQVAEFAKPCKIKNSLHTYELAIADDGDMAACVLLCCYAYCQAWWEPGPPARHHTHYQIQKKSVCGAGDAYDPGFMAHIGD